MEKNKIGVMALCGIILIVPLLALIFLGILDPFDMSHVSVYVVGVVVPIFFLWRIVGGSPRRDSR